MSEDRSIHDLLERAVQGVSPSTVDPERAVLTLARRERRRSVVLAAVTIVAVVLGGAGLLNVVDTQTRGDGPAAGPGERSAAWTAGQPEDVLGRDTAIELDGGLTVSLLTTPLVATPLGWTDFPPEPVDGQVTAGDLKCPSAGQVVYRTSISSPGSIDSPCIGDDVGPYIWARSGRSPEAGPPVVQTMLTNGEPVWIQAQPSGAAGKARGRSPFVRVFVPASGLSLTAVGVAIDELLTYLVPAVSETKPFAAPQAEPDLHALVIRAERNNNAHAVSDVELAELSAELEIVEASGEQPCVTINYQYQIEFRIASLTTALVVVDNVDGCAMAVSSLGGGAARVSPGLVPMLVGLSLED